MSAQQEPAYTPDQVDVDPYSIPLEDIDIANPYLFGAGAHYAWFKRLREEAPVHYCADSFFGPYWSVSSYDEIVQVDTSHDIYSSEPAITIRDTIEEFPLPMFIAMDRPKHDEQRKVVSPVTGAENLRHFEPIIRERTIDVLDNLPVGETFDWVDRVSVELTTRMLATLFDFPFDERRKLTRWSDVATAIPGLGLIDTEEQRHEEMLECLEYFTELWNVRVNDLPKNDLISMLAHGDATRDMSPAEYLGNLVLLIVGGNDTTRSTMTASAYAMHNNPDQFDLVRTQPELIDDMVSETIRWQTPLAHMRRIAKVDTELGGKQIKAGDKVVMWYVSGNRDESFTDRPDDFNIQRPNIRKHLSFGFGIHRCMGNKLAELQLRILWQEILKRFDRVEVMEEPERTISAFVNGYTSMPVRLHPKAS
ncbi:MAG: cytochrome P450 [Halioglobus sp.]|jgi:cytochrome P450